MAYRPPIYSGKSADSGNSRTAEHAIYAQLERQALLQELAKRLTYILFAMGQGSAPLREGYTFPWEPHLKPPLTLRMGISNELRRDERYPPSRRGRGAAPPPASRDPPRPPEQRRKARMEESAPDRRRRDANAVGR